MYKIIKPLEMITVHTCILRIEDNTVIPLDPNNSDYQAYLTWVAEGNTPEPAEEQA